MRLDRPFYQLPILFDAARLRAEVAALPATAWVDHPDKVPGNSALRLISVDGAENDAVHGQMRSTQWLEAMPYARQVLAGFGVVWGRSRLMRLAPGTGVPEHADINYHWHTRVRLHIPILTEPSVRFHCDGESVHMGAGEAWIFDNWRRHHVENAAQTDRIHLVADTTGTAAFWNFVRGPRPPRADWQQVPWQSGTQRAPMTECNERQPVMPAAEVEWLLDDLRRELCCAPDTPATRENLLRFEALLSRFVQDWRQLCARHGTSGRSVEAFRDAVKVLRSAITPYTPNLRMRTNAAEARLVLEKRVLQHLVTA